MKNANQIGKLAIPNPVKLLDLETMIFRVVEEMKMQADQLLNYESDCFERDWTVESVEQVVNCITNLGDMIYDFRFMFPEYLEKAEKLQRKVNKHEKKFIRDAEKAVAA